LNDKLVPHPIERTKEQRRPLALFQREANPLASLASSVLLYLNDKLVPHPIERTKEQRRPLALF